MTCIAFRDGVLAADTLESWGNAVFPGSEKIRVVSGHLIGLSGDAGACEKFVHWFASDRTKDADFKTEEFYALVVGVNGRMQGWDKNLSPYDINIPFFAIGSGRDFAIGAMERGATAAEAVAVACKWDASCGGEVVIRTINDLVEKPKRARKK